MVATERSPAMRMQLIINERAGSVVGADAGTVADQVARTLAAAGHEVEASVVMPEQFDREIERACRKDLEALIVGGGDGSVRFAATSLLDSPTALGVLPLGTINRLARDIGMPLDFRAAAHALATARTQSIDVAEVNGRIFVCNAILGLTTHFSRTRQHLRGRPLDERLRGYWSAVRNLLRSRRRVAVRIEDGVRRQSLRVLSLAVTNNVYAEEPGLTMRRAELDGGQLAVYAGKHSSGWRMAASAVRVLFGGLSDDRDVVQLSAPTLRIGVRGRRVVPISIDGEIEDLSTPLVFAIRPRALRVLVPRPEGDS